MAAITVELVSVEEKLWHGEASIVTAETTEGEVGVLPGHEPMLGQLVENGVVTIRPVDGDRLVAAVQGGFLSVSAEKVIILADYAVWATDVDVAAAQADLGSQDDLVRSRADAALKAQRRLAQA